MKGVIVYIKGHEASEKQAQDALKSFQKYGWDVELREGITPDTLEESEYNYPIIMNSRLSSYYDSNLKSYLTKKSCLSNQIKLWREVIEADEPMAFIEHDAICIGKFDYEVNELLCLNVEYAFSPPSILANYPNFKDYAPPLAIKPTSPCTYVPASAYL